jgi:methionyl-tRNA formyltransferase
VSRTCVLLTSESHHATSAEIFLRTLFDLRHVEHVHEGMSFPEHLAAEAEREPPDLLVSFLSPVVVPSSVLAAVRIAAVNIHPAPPERRGVGCVSYALYDGDATFGVTAHLMTEALDAGPIIRVRRFAITPGDDNGALSRRAHDYSLIVLYEVMHELATASAAPRSDEHWQGPLRTRLEFRRWATVSSEDPPDEVRRKIRAVRHEELPGPFVELAGARFSYDEG